MKLLFIKAEEKKFRLRSKPSSLNLEGILIPKQLRMILKYFNHAYFQQWEPAPMPKGEKYLIWFCSCLQSDNFSSTLEELNEGCYRISHRMINNIKAEKNLIITEGNFQLWAIKDFYILTMQLFQTWAKRSNSQNLQLQWKQ